MNKIEQKSFMKERVNRLNEATLNTLKMAGLASKKKENMSLEQIINKYNLAPNSYYSSSPYRKAATEQDKERYRQFCDKWLPYTEEGWYGPTGLGHPTPIKIYDALDEFLQYLVDKNPNMQIHQIKWKFGSLRLYIAGLHEESQQEVLRFCDVCADKFLVY